MVGSYAMNKYHVTQFTQTFEVYEVEADSEDEARDKMAYQDSMLVDTYTKDSYIADIEEQ
jgi:hypothetical protein